MRPLIRILLVEVGILVFASAVCAQKDLLVPAGTLLQCTMNEPDFSSATAIVGDPVICHLRAQHEFGRILFPRGSMLGGHLEAEKEPGHFLGKGYLKITFDRVILPYGDIPVPAKVIQAKGFKVDKKGDIDGKGHAKRDVAEWMIPLLWPWKVISLPMRGPRPALKGEESLELRLMDDISIPATMAYGPMKPDRPPYASQVQPSLFDGGSAKIAEPAVDRKIASESPAAAANWKLPIPCRVLVLKSNETFTLCKYRRDGDVLLFEQSDGSKVAVDMDSVNWRKTTARNQIVSAD